MNPVRRRLWMMICLCLALLTALPALAQSDTVTLDHVNDIARSLYCPVCPNETLDSCRTDACARWREEIRQQLVAGRTQEQIVADFVARYGERVLPTPQDPLLRGIAIYIPYLLLIAAAGAALFTLLRWRSMQRADSPTPAAQDAADPDYRARLERDLES